MSDSDLLIPESQKDLDEIMEQKRAKSFFTIFMLILIIIALFFCSLFVGYANITPQELIQIWMGNGNWQNTYIVNQIRMPRVACAAVVGAGLAVAGMAMQALFKNPLASPSVLGISSGAAFGANLCIAFGVGAVFGSFSISVMCLG